MIPTCSKNDYFVLSMIMFGRLRTEKHWLGCGFKWNQLILPGFDNIMKGAVCPN